MLLARMVWMSSWIVKLGAIFLVGRTSQLSYFFQIYRLAHGHASLLGAGRWSILHRCGSTSQVEADVRFKSTSVVTSQWDLACEVNSFKLSYYECYICNSDEWKKISRNSIYLQLQFRSIINIFNCNTSIILIFMWIIFWTLFNLYLFTLNEIVSLDISLHQRFKAISLKEPRK